ncbi:hypothetical protein FJY71_03060, partial [candidate division WOR-3 bacterium]|nr:hypothetical protein [candidate division WOR-3 bacterium]
WLTNRVMMPRSDGRILSSFYNGDVGALLRPEIAGRHEEPADFVVVYARAGFGEYILPAIGRHPETTFRVFPSAEYDFAQSLAACRGVIAPAGHQLTSEALHLRKPLLAFPQENQYEQDLNARMLERSGWGIRGGMDRIEEDVDRFLKLVPFFPLHPEEPGVVFRYDDCTDPATRRLELMLESLKARRRRPRECQSTADLT